MSENKHRIDVVSLDVEIIIDGKQYHIINRSPMRVAKKRDVFAGKRPSNKTGQFGLISREPSIRVLSGSNISKLGRKK